MNMTHDQMVEVIQAHQEGKTLEARDIGTSAWTRCRQPPSWDFRDYEYRIKPEPPKPREFWIWLYDNDKKPHCISAAGYAHLSREAAIRGGSIRDEPPLDIIRVREVLPETN